MAGPIYSTVGEVKRYTGVKPKTVGFEETDTNGLDAQLVKWLENAKSLIDTETGRDFHGELAAGRITEIPPAIHDIATRIVRNLIAQAQMSRQGPIIQVDEYRQRVVDDTVMTRAILRDLQRHVAKTSSQPRFMRVRRRSEMAPRTRLG